MPEDLLQQGHQYLAEQLEAFMSVPVVYKRGAHQVALQAVKGRSTLDLVSAEGSSYQIRTTDFLVVTEKLILNGQATEPKQGDLVEQTIGGKVHKFKVLSRSGVAHFVPLDPHSTMLRVFTELQSIT